MIPLPANESGHEMATFYDDAETCATTVDMARPPPDPSLYSDIESLSDTVSTDNRVTEDN